jgi:hypothetical protein
VSLLGLRPLSVYVLATYTVALAPFVVLTTYILRTATVARRTLSTSSFTLDEAAMSIRDSPVRPDRE